MTSRQISEPKRFQRATAAAALETMAAKKGPRRFLIADEVGLGKTIVARTIVHEMIKRQRRPLVVFYVSSNLNIAHQNRSKLLELLPTKSDQDAASARADRLTLAANPKNRPDHDKLHLYTLTPDTSVPMYRKRGGFGRLEERALIFREGALPDAGHDVVFGQVPRQPGAGGELELSVASARGPERRAGPAGPFSQSTRRRHPAGPRRGGRPLACRGRL